MAQKTNKDGKPIPNGPSTTEKNQAQIVEIIRQNQKNSY